jgi:hypothetical protein
MKKINKLFSVLLGVSVLATAMTSTVSAVGNSVIGDVDNNGSVSASDLVCLSQLLNGAKEVYDTDISRFDVNNNMIVSHADLEALKNILLS